MKAETYAEKIELKLRRARIEEMERPTILMNDIDIEEFIKEVESRVVNFKVVASNLTYEGKPIKANSLLRRGTIIVYDDSPTQWMRTDNAKTK